MNKPKSKTQYDNIAAEYRDISMNKEKRYVMAPTLLHLLGSVKSKKVLDLGCGFGYFTRLLKEQGASNVVGVDVSKEMIKLAMEEESRNPSGIEYKLDNVINLNKLDEFDTVTGLFFMHYSKDKEELLGMCNSIYKNLKKGGIFATIVDYPCRKNLDLSRYGLVIKAQELRDGSPVEVTLNNKGKNVKFSVYFWQKETYESALKQAGFKEIMWSGLIVSKEGKEMFDKGFWDYFLQNPPCIGLKCTK